jgi:hypothetical protein
LIVRTSVQNSHQTFRAGAGDAAPTKVDWGAVA